MPRLPKRSKVLVQGDPVMLSTAVYSQAAWPQPRRCDATAAAAASLRQCPVAAMARVSGERRAETVTKAYRDVEGLGAADSKGGMKSRKGGGGVSLHHLTFHHLIMIRDLRLCTQNELANPAAAAATKARRTGSRPLRDQRRISSFPTRPGGVKFLGPPWHTATGARASNTW